MADRQHPQSRHHRRPPRDQTMDTRTIQQMVREARRAQILSQHRPPHIEGDAHARCRRPDPAAPRVPPHRPVPRRQRPQHRQLPEPMARQLLPQPRLPLDRIAGHDHRTHQPAHRRDHPPPAHHAPTVVHGRPAAHRHLQTRFEDRRPPHRPLPEGRAQTRRARGMELQTPRPRTHRHGRLHVPTPRPRQHPQRRVPPRPPHLQPRQTPAHDRTARATLLLLLRIPAQQRQHPIPATPPH